MAALTLAVLLSWAAPPMERPALGPAPPSMPAPRIFDGRVWVRVERVDASTLRWDGHAVGVDRHALVWLADPEDDGVLRELARLGVRAVSTPSPDLGLIRVRGRATEDGLDLSLRLMAAGLDGVKATLPDIQIPHRLHESSRPDDPRFPGQWFFERIELEGAWALEDGDPTVDIVVVDNGCDLEHPDLVDKLDSGRDVLDGDDDPGFEPNERSNEHGTACAGLAGAATNNAVGIAGTCPQCRVRCVRLLSETQPVPLSADVAAYQYALDVGADVVSSSWGFVEAIPVPAPFRAILERLVDEGRDGKGTVLAFAAGNDNREIGPEELQAVRGVLAVGATNNFDETAPFSNRGRAVDIVAPTGTNTTDVQGPDGENEGDYTTLFGGTSSACPIAAGVAGLMLSADPALRSADLTRILQETARQSFFATPGSDGHDGLYGHGLIQPAAALRVVLGVEPPDEGMDMSVRDLGADAGESDFDLGSGAPDAGGFDPAPRASLDDDGPGCRQLGLQTGSGWLLLAWGAWRRARRRRHVL